MKFSIALDAVYFSGLESKIREKNQLSITIDEDKIASVAMIGLQMASEFWSKGHIITAVNDGCFIQFLVNSLNKTDIQIHRLCQVKAV